MDIFKEIIEAENRRRRRKTDAELIHKSEVEQVDEVVNSSEVETSEFPNRGHLPGRGYFQSGKVVTNPGLNHNGWVDTTQ